MTTASGSSLLLLLAILPLILARRPLDAASRQDPQAAGANSKSQLRQRRLQAGGKACKSELGKCRRSERCCGPLVCGQVTRVLNKQGGKKKETRCVSPDTADPIVLGRQKLACSAVGQKCNRRTCCGGLTCKSIKKTISKQGAFKFQETCVDPSSMPMPVGIPRWTVKELLDGPTPFAVGHRGFGADGDVPPGSPRENTIKSVMKAFKDGIRIVEIDVVMTRDGVPVVNHEDHLTEDLTCLNSLSLKELKEQKPFIPTLKAVLRKARKYSFKKEMPNAPSGLVEIELKAPSPHCDPQDETELRYANIVAKVIMDTAMADQVLLMSFSPVLTDMVGDAAPGLTTALGLAGAMLLTPETVLALTGLELEPVPKLHEQGFGLQWYQGGIFRLPSYSNVQEFLNVAFTIGAKVLLVETEILQQAEGQQACGHGDRRGGQAIGLFPACISGQ